MRITHPVGLTLYENSSTTPLSGGATYTGTWFHVEAFSSIVCVAKSDVDGTMYMDFIHADQNTTPLSSDTPDSSIPYTVEGGITEPPHELRNARGWFRTRYVNGSSAQSSFQIIATVGGSGLIIAPSNLSLAQNADCIVARTIPFEEDVSEGKRRGYSIVNKFGANDAVSTLEDIWDGGGPYTGFPSGSPELVTVNSSVSGDDSDFAIKIFGLDANGALQEETITLDGTNLVDSVNTYTRVFRGLITSSGTSNTEFTAGTITCAHKVTTANVFFVMPAGVNQTRVACYTIPAGYTGYLKSLDVEMQKSGSATATGGIYVKNNGAPPRVINNFTISSSSPHIPKIYGGLNFPALTDIAIRILTVSSGSIATTANFDLILVKN